MLASGIAGLSRRDFRLGQIAIGLILLQPLAVYALTIVGLMQVALGIVPFNPLPVAVLVVSLGLFLYLRLHIGRGWLFRLYPNWVSQWPHKWIFALSLVGSLLWYFLGVSIMGGNVALFRFGYTELLFLMLLEAFLAGDQAKAERVLRRRAVN